MRKLVFSLMVLACSGIKLQAQELSSSELLNKAIAFHDPNGQWNAFKGTFKVLMKTPNSNDRLSTLSMNHPEQTFKLSVEKDGASYSYTFNGDRCITELNGSTEISEEDRKKLRLTCERGKMMRNYYTYLYGLPMKLRDPGTILDSVVQTKTFKGKEYLVLKVNYDEEVGKDVWYFYFDPNTFAMEVYQFYHEEEKNDGEYILLEGLEKINGIKMPKVRAWYLNNTNKHLGTDYLEK
ncbi:hypothetical protein GTQ34_06030 [Muricauda sp. JGD-17]|uniref:Uncharacterized protein n=1 Tax=Flagellimonas ochracea TaxID=2696472 RepID=A0A964TC02_9FLAO|nr:DUF6503 family protein [Allomuricauda ochracea]NAY91469.1 hypothetical protein [Allomuricauda ochracea]